MLKTLRSLARAGREKELTFQVIDFHVKGHRTENLNYVSLHRYCLNRLILLFSAFSIFISEFQTLDTFTFQIRLTAHTGLKISECIVHKYLGVILAMHFIILLAITGFNQRNI